MQIILVICITILLLYIVICITILLLYTVYLKQVLELYTVTVLLFRREKYIRAAVILSLMVKKGKSPLKVPVIKQPSLPIKKPVNNFKAKNKFQLKD